MCVCVCVCVRVRVRARARARARVRVSEWAQTPVHNLDTRLFIVMLVEASILITAMGWFLRGFL